MSIGVPVANLRVQTTRAQSTEEQTGGDHPGVGTSEQSDGDRVEADTGRMPP